MPTVVAATSTSLAATLPPTWVKFVGVYTYTVTLEGSSEPKLAGIKLIFGESNGFYDNYKSMDFWTTAYTNEPGTRLYLPISLDNPGIGTVYVIVYKLVDESCLAAPGITVVGRQINNNTGQVLSYIAQATGLDQDKQYVSWSDYCPPAGDLFWQPAKWVPTVKPNA